MTSDDFQAAFSGGAFASLICLTVAICFLVIIGWITGARLLTSVRSGYFAMPLSTTGAALLTTSALALTVYRPGSRQSMIAARGINLVLLAFTVVILLGNIYGTEPSLEERLFGARGELNGIPEGRMSLIAAVMFLVLNLAVLILGLGSRSKPFHKSVAACLGALVTAGGGITLLGYLYGTPLLYGGSTRPVALLAALSFTLLGAALIIGAGKDSWPLGYFVGNGVRAQILRTVLPLVAGFIALEGWLDAVVPDRFDTNRVYVSVITAIVFLGIALYIFTKVAQKIGGAVDRADRERDLAEARQQAALEELERSNAELQQFAYVASHDLQEPLRVITSYVQLISRRYAELVDDEGREFIDFIVSGTKRMHDLINDLLAYSRAGGRSKPAVALDSNDALNQALANLEVSIKEKGAVINRGMLPEVVGDENQLAQLFQNLIGNAIKYSGDKEPRIDIGADGSDDFWRFSVSDDGIGFDPKYAEKIFVIFQKLHGHERYAGTGIGLAISKRIVEKHGGRIWVESEPGKGSTFYFTIPREGTEE
ncbi:MAG: ATP-binding protein [Actinobacteria bacterium]|nr:ATP-binding protein [Actinomycetota bacterium]MCL5883075.1 ATP-binding protein [Actinomycetota bacterium]